MTMEPVKRYQRMRGQQVPPRSPGIEFIVPSPGDAYDPDLHEVENATHVQVPLGAVITAVVSPGSREHKAYGRGLGGTVLVPARKALVRVGPPPEKTQEAVLIADAVEPGDVALEPSEGKTEPPAPVASEVREHRVPTNFGQLAKLWASISSDSGCLPTAILTAIGPDTLKYGLEMSEQLVGISSASDWFEAGAAGDAAVSEGLPYLNIMLSCWARIRSCYQPWGGESRDVPPQVRAMDAGITRLLQRMEAAGYEVLIPRIGDWRDDRIHHRAAIRPMRPGESRDRVVAVHGVAILRKGQLLYRAAVEITGHVV